MKRAIILLCTVLIAVPALGENLVLVNGTIIDGTLKARSQGSVRIRDGKIVQIGVFKPAAGEAVLDIKGLIAAPGFIDLHNTSANGISKDPGAVSQITQGITTALTGIDGAGAYAVEEFMFPFDEKQPALNIMALVGHGTVRRQIMGPDYKRAATADEIQRMGDLVIEAMREGAFGTSSNPQDELQSYSTIEEVVALGKATARGGGTYYTRLRNETDKVLDAVREAIRIGREAKVAVQISPLGKAAAVLAEIDKARAAGVDIAADIHTSENDPRAFVQHPWVMFTNGASQRVLTQFVREQKLLTLERAIRKMTGLPASRLGLKGRGVLARGAAADVVVFDALSGGMKYVFVNGTMVVKEGQPTGERPGQALR